MKILGNCVQFGINPRSSSPQNNVFTVIYLLTCSNLDDQEMLCFQYVVVLFSLTLKETKLPGTEFLYPLKPAAINTFRIIDLLKNFQTFYCIISGKNIL